MTKEELKTYIKFLRIMLYLPTGGIVIGIIFSMWTMFDNDGVFLFATAVGVACISYTSLLYIITKYEMDLKMQEVFERLPDKKESE